jgi:hypothetical protein
MHAKFLIEQGHTCASATLRNTFLTSLPSETRSVQTLVCGTLLLLEQCVHSWTHPDNNETNAGYLSCRSPKPNAASSDASVLNVHPPRHSMCCAAPPHPKDAAVVSRSCSATLLHMWCTTLPTHSLLQPISPIRLTWRSVYVRSRYT